MKKLLFFAIAFFLICTKASSQEEKQLANQNGIKVSYKLILESKDKKKDKYIIIAKAENTSGKDLFYSVKLTKNQSGEFELPVVDDDKGFTRVEVLNSTALFGSAIPFLGEETHFTTTNNERIFKIVKGNVYSRKLTFRVKSGHQPVVSNSYLNPLKAFEDFVLKATPDMLNGNYVSNCGNTLINVSVQNSPTRGEYLLQTVDGRHFIWVHSTETSFRREDLPGYTLTFNKDKKTFSYSTIDGVSCVWRKE